ncbi:MAG: DUF3179 domain-containing (seleno)protein [Isosphaerales bacterium]
MTRIESNDAGPGSERPKPPVSKRPKRLLPLAFTLAAIVVVSFYLQAQARNLWNECSMLLGEVRESQRRAVVGYLNIAPITTYAEPPADWYHIDGEQSRLWSGWKDGDGHRWFRFQQGEIDPARLCRPTSEYVSRAIDYPLVETGGGTIWQRIPSEAMVVGHTLRGQNCVYPTAVLGKVQVINDIVEDHPFLVVVNLFLPHQAEFSIYEATLDERRLTMATTGYFQDGKPLLYDRGTESLWLEHENALRAVAGKHKNKPLARVARPVPVTWGTWKSRNRQSRLLVGADRSRGVPKE